jgi:hypothetical protein
MRVLSNERPIKTQQYSQEGRSTMGNRGVPYIAGIKNTYEKGKFTIDEYIPRDDVKHDKTKMYVVKGFDDDSFMRFDGALNWNDVEENDNRIHLEEIRLINSTNLAKAIEFMEKNKKGFEFFMKTLQETEKQSKSMAFLNTVKDYYDNHYIFTIPVMSKVMIKYGYDFTSLKEIRELMYK